MKPRTRVVLLLLGAACAQNALADEGKWSLNAGLKLWASDWQAGLNNMSPTNDNVVESSSDRKIVPVGSLDLRYKDLVASATYFKRSTYQFPSVADGGQRFDMQVERFEYDVDLGWRVVPQLVLAVGYKNIQLRYKVRTFAALEGDRTNFDIFTLAMKGYAPLNDGLGLYGNLAAGQAQAKYSAGGSNQGWYTATEVGLSYALGKRLAATFGYKTEILNLSIGNHANRDVITGFLGGLNYTFF